MGVLDRTWRSASSLDILQDTKLGSSTVRRARRWSFQRELTLMNAFSSIRGILHLRFHPLVLNLSWNPPLLLFIFQMCLMTLQSILLPHSCLFMGETVLLLLNSLLFALSHLLRPSCSTQPQCLHPHPLAPHPLIQIPLLSLLPSLHLPLLALNARDVPEKSGIQSNGQYHSATDR